MAPKRQFDVMGRSYAERSQQVGQALVKWLNEGVLTPLIKGEQD